MSKLITTTKELARFCAGLKGAAFVTVDTEFMRERTYYSKLCLVQLGGPDEAVAIDPLAEGIDLAPLFALMDDPNILKVFHAARQDVEIFVNLTGRVPTPLYDTQVAAMVCGFGEQVGYETLVSAVAKSKVDKSSRFTDWARRPLTERQVDYALADVTHLRAIYEKLSEKVKKTRRADWVAEEMEVLTSLSTYQIEPAEVWRRLKFRSDKPRRCAILRELAAWREIEAQRANLPRGRIVKDEALIEIASSAPATTEELARTRGLSQGFAEGKHGTAILETVKRAKALPAEACPAIKEKRGLSNGATAVFDLLKVLLHQVSAKHDVAAKLIATTDDLEALASEDSPDIKSLKGWRLGLFGETALALKAGKLALAVKDRKIETVRIED